MSRTVHGPRSTVHARGERGPAGPSRTGFTLLEFLVVLVIIAIVGAIIGPAFQNTLPSVRVSKAGEAFLATARKGHMDAALTGKRHRLYLRKIDSEAGPAGFWLAFEPRPLEEGGTFKPLPGSWGQATALPEMVTVLSSEGAVEAETGEVYMDFNVDGTATEATIVFQSQNGDQITVQIKGATGQAKVPPPEEEPK